MDRQSIITYKESFDAIATYITGDEGNEQVEVWFARDLQSVLGYARWENFQTAIGRAVDSCKSLNVNVDDHFREVTKMIPLAKGAHREIQDYMLTRYACYLIAQNGDPKKPGDKVHTPPCRLPSDLNHCCEESCHRNDQL